MRPSLFAHANALRRQPLVVRTAVVGEVADFGRQLDWLSLRRAEAGASFNRGVPMWRPGSVGLAAAGSPAEHRRVPRDAQRSAQLRQYAFGIREHVIRVDHRRCAAEPVVLALEKFRLPLKAEILERRALALAQI